MADLVFNQIKQRAWQESIISKIDFTTSEPGSPSVGDRYINTVTGTSSVTAQSVTAEYIYEWNGIDWSETIPLVGYVLWDITVVEYFHYTGSVWVPLNDVTSILNLASYVSLSTNGDNSFSGKNVDTPVLTIANAITKALALSPSFNNPVLIDALDGDNYTLGVSAFTVPSYVHLDMRGSALSGTDYSLDDYAKIRVHRQSASALAISKTSGSNEAYVHINEKLFLSGGSEGIRCTSGRIDAIIANVEGGAGNLIAQLSDGDINIDVPGRIYFTAGQAAHHDGSGRVNMRFNDVRNDANTTFQFQGGSGYNTLTANRVSSGGAAFNMPTAGQYLTAIVGEVEEVLPSTKTYLNHIFGLYRKSGDLYDLYTIISNVQEGVLIESAASKPIQIRSGGTLGLYMTDTTLDFLNRFYINTTEIGLNHFVRFTADSVAVKRDSISGTTGVTSTTTNYVVVPAGAKIRSVIVKVTGGAGFYIYPNDQITVNSHFTVVVPTAGNNISISIPSGQTNVASKSFIADVEYNV